MPKVFIPERYSDLYDTAKALGAKEAARVIEELGLSELRVKELERFIQERERGTES